MLSRKKQKWRISTVYRLVSFFPLTVRWLVDRTNQSEYTIFSALYVEVASLACFLYVKRTVESEMISPKI